MPQIQLPARRHCGIRSLLLAAAVVVSWPQLSPGAPANYPYMSWQDEFDGTSVESARWAFDIGTGTQYGLTGWGNNELQYYTNRSQNASVSNGTLKITALKENYGGQSYTSARLKTQGLFSQAGGRFEIRAALPTGQGFWPAIWMMPASDTYGGWAASGEIDIMEARGQQPDRVNGAIHYGGTWPSNTWSESTRVLPAGQTISSFHTYALEWDTAATPAIRWYVDDVLYATKTLWWSSGAAYPAPFDKPFYMLLNLAVGGNYVGSPNGSTPFPATMQVDYVRVSTAAPPAITLAATSGTLSQAAVGNPVIAAAASVTKTGTGMVVLNAANAYTGTTSIVAGTLAVSNPAGLSGSPVTVNSGGSLAIAGAGSTTIPSVTVNAGGAMTLRSDIPQKVSLQGLTITSGVALTVDSETMTNGYMNVFAPPSAGGGYLSGSGWAVKDLRAQFTGSTSVTLAPCYVADSGTYWYTPSGQPGATGNKIMEANVYGQADGTYAGQSVKFSGTVPSYTLQGGTSGWSVKAFIRDFTADYSSYNEQAVPISATGSFSVRLNAVNDPTRHVQWGLQMKGPDVWITELASKGTVVVSALPTAADGGGGKVDAGQGLITVAAGLSALDLEAEIIAGRGDGSWRGVAGITSSLVAAEVARGIPRSIGWMEDGDGSLSFGYSAPGDTNNDWQVDVLDVANFFAGGKFDTGFRATWTDSDFNYDGVVDMLDAADFFSAGLFDAGAYNPAAAGNVAAVPEPSLTLLGVAIACLRRRRSATGGRTTGRSQGSRTR
jgi:autotransporter-associated beta strand protein